MWLLKVSITHWLLASANERQAKKPKDQSEAAQRKSFWNRPNKISNIWNIIWNMEFRSGIEIGSSTLDRGHDTFLWSKKVLELELGFQIGLGMTFFDLPWYWRRNSSHLSWYFSLSWFSNWSRFLVGCSYPPKLEQCFSANRKEAPISKPTLVSFHQKHPIAKDPSNNQKA